MPRGCATLLQSQTAAHVRRLVSPLALRQFLLWLGSTNTATPEPEWKGYLLALALGTFSFVMTVVLHQQPWCALG